MSSTSKSKKNTNSTKTSSSSKDTSAVTSFTTSNTVKKPKATSKISFRLKMGLEIHATLLTERKAFVNIPVTSSSFTSLGLLGTLPQINTEAIRLVLKLSKALNVEIPSEIEFVRKSYFYFDLPKGYQITQKQNPFSKKGYVFLPKSIKKIGISAVSLEEDTAAHGEGEGENVHILLPERLGNPLVEIATEPELRTSEEVLECIKWIRFLLFYLNISRAEMEHGNFRVDLNISLEGDKNQPLTGRAEVKNLASLRAIADAIPAVQEYFLEQIKNKDRDLFEDKTFKWDDKKAELIVMRKKTSSEDYLLVPESCIPKIKLSDKEIKKITKDCESHKLLSLFESIQESPLASREQEEIIDNYEFFRSCLQVREVLGEWSNAFFALKIFNSVGGKISKVKNLIDFLNQLLKALKLKEFGRDFKFNNLKIRESCKKLIGNNPNIKSVVTYYLDSPKIEKQEIIGFCESVLSEQNQELHKLADRPDRLTSFLIGRIKKQYGKEVEVKDISNIISSNISQWMEKYFPSPEKEILEENKS
ncbi:aspartyl/glutamyl-tRNA(Asn/Gln) amidotransferase subunit B [Mycoplasma suis KI3806]|uniref:Aspartyl/glutamyl-tRNA(Asn/Gln) amidotransferase subunit B n=1 Tax=Mycoplasma suis (strain KI_3806) TaxID=708248 RepID=F0V1I7_MYCS3|nr:aspartyl/glutamyl-tRNA amidotransferase subunit B [Mycoplasma suis]CBZ40518.1 aspartyl/glutamyl-tRNA(Asn/Gln) amidotransferase subunit B [Mycoplasma suis KI3806]